MRQIRGNTFLFLFTALQPFSLPPLTAFQTPKLTNVCDCWTLLIIQQELEQLAPFHLPTIPWSCPSNPPCVCKWYTAFHALLRTYTDFGYDAGHQQISVNIYWFIWVSSSREGTCPEFIRFPVVWKPLGTQKSGCKSLTHKHCLVCYPPSNPVSLRGQTSRREN